MGNAARILVLSSIAGFLAAADHSVHPLCAAATRTPGLDRPPAGMDRDRDGRWSALELVIATARSPDFVRQRLPGVWAVIDRDRDGRATPLEVAAAVDAGPGAGCSVAARPATIRPGSRPTSGVGTNLGFATASLSITRETAYISGYDVVGGQLDPQISTLRTGTILTVGDILVTIR